MSKFRWLPLIGKPSQKPVAGQLLEYASSVDKRLHVVDQNGRDMAVGTIPRLRAATWRNPAGLITISYDGLVTAATAGQCWFLPIKFDRSCTISKLQVYVWTAATAGDVRYGLYADDGQSSPVGSPLIDSGQKSATTGVVSVYTLGTPYVVTEELYWLAFKICNNITGTAGRCVAMETMLLDGMASGAGIDAGGAGGSLPFRTDATNTLPTGVTYANLTWYYSSVGFDVPLVQAYVSALN